MQELLPLAFIAVMFVGFYLLVLRPAKRRQVEAQNLVASVQPGDEVMTTAGIYGTVVAMDQDTISLQVSPGVELKYAKAAVARIIVQEPAAGSIAGASADAAAAAPDEVAAASGAAGGAQTGPAVDGTTGADADNPYKRGQS